MADALALGGDEGRDKLRKVTGSPNHSCYGMNGVVGPRHCMKFCEKNGLESPVREGDNPVFEARRSIVES